jgi:hypothetical protein
MVHQKAACQYSLSRGTQCDMPNEPEQLHRISAVELSQCLDVSRAAAHYWLSGKVRPSLKHACRLLQLGIVIEPPRRRGGRPRRSERATD